MLLQDKTVAVLEVAGAKQIKLGRTLKGHSKAVDGVDFDDEHIVSASRDETVKVWSMSTGECLQTLGHNCSVTCVQLSGELVVSGSRGMQLLSDGEIVGGDQGIWNSIRMPSKRSTRENRKAIF